MKKTISVLLLLTMLLSMSINVMAFSDFNSSHWAYDDVMNMLEKGIIKGYTDGSFKPDKEITRAEYCVLLARAANLESDFPSTT